MHAFESEDRLMVVSGVCLHMFFNWWEIWWL